MRALAPWLGFLLFCNWVAAVWGFRLSLEMFKSFRIGTPVFTQLVIAVNGGILIWLFTAGVATSSVLVALRTRLGWWLALAVCLLCAFIFAGCVLPILALLQAHRGGIFTPVAIPFSSAIQRTMQQLTKDGSFVPLASFILTQLLLVTLIWKRRALINER